MTPKIKPFVEHSTAVAHKMMQDGSRKPIATVITTEDGQILSEKLNTEHKGRTFAELTKSITELHEKKNADYCNAFSVLFQRKEKSRKGAGLEYAATRIFEKASRVESLSMAEAQVKSESVIDTLLDIAAYALMTVEELEK